MQYITAVCLYI